MWSVSIIKVIYRKGHTFTAFTINSFFQFCLYSFLFSLLLVCWNVHFGNSEHQQWTRKTRQEQQQKAIDKLQQLCWLNFFFLLPYSDIFPAEFDWAHLRHHSTLQDDSNEKVKDQNKRNDKNWSAEEVSLCQTHKIIEMSFTYTNNNWVDIFDSYLTLGNNFFMLFNKHK